MFKKVIFLSLVCFLLANAYASENIDARWGCGYYQEIEGEGFNFSPCWQISAGLGESFFSPDDSDSSWSLDSDTDTAYRFSMTYQALPHLFAELVYADLGAAEFTNSNALIDSAENISYQVPALFLGSDYPLLIAPIDIYAKLGAAKLATDSSHDFLTAEEDSSIQLAWGLGARYKLSRRWQLRSDFEAFSEDSSLLSVSLSYVLGAKSYRYQKAQAKFERDDLEEKYVATQSAAKPVTGELTQAVSDKDGDGVPDDKDRCVTEEAYIQKVDNNGCVIYSGNFLPTSFAFGQSTINSESEILQSYLTILRENPDTRLFIHGHTDSVGSDRYNFTLSEQRALAVKAYLQSQGIQPKRLMVKGFGERQPKASNATVLGRAANRRVELFIRLP